MTPTAKGAGERVKPICPNCGYNIADYVEHSDGTRCRKCGRIITGLEAAQQQPKEPQ